jgi:glutathione synthase/RimK-type ligase-like ATP-grasp enzyme
VYSPASQTRVFGIIMTILFVEGINDLAKVGVTLDRNNHFVNLLDGNCAIQGRLPLNEEIAANVVLFGRGVKQYQFTFKTKPTLIFNQIADADTHRGSLERCIELCTQLDTTVINHPEKILRTSRDQVAVALQGIAGVTMPRTLRITPRSPDDVFDSAASADLGFPFITRMVGKHGGESVILVNSNEDYPALHVYPFDGREFYLTEYVDLKNNEGLYHKQRVVVIDGEPILRHTLFDQSWKVHAASRSFMAAHEDSLEKYHARARWFETDVIPKARPAINEITRRLGLDYYGIDCNMSADGHMYVFEANANMNVLFNKLDELNPLLDRIKERIQAMLTRYSGEKVI